MSMSESCRAEDIPEEADASDGSDWGPPPSGQGWCPLQAAPRTEGPHRVHLLSTCAVTSIGTIPIVGALSVYCIDLDLALNCCSGPNGRTTLARNPGYVNQSMQGRATASCMRCKIDMGWMLNAR
jgi:hypothetical protein